MFHVIYIKHNIIGIPFITKDILKINILNSKQQFISIIQ